MGSESLKTTLHTQIPWEFPNLVVAMAVCGSTLLRSFALLSGLAFALLCTHLLFCALLRTTAFRTTALGTAEYTPPGEMTTKIIRLHFGCNFFLLTIGSLLAAELHYLQWCFRVFSTCHWRFFAYKWSFLLQGL